jgi:hypothetical protein
MGVVHTGARVPKVAKCCFLVTTTLKSATLLHEQNTSKGDDRRIATAAYSRKGLWP